MDIGRRIEHEGMQEFEIKERRVEAASDVFS